MNKCLLKIGILLTILSSGCTWESSLYDMYVSDNGLISCPPRVFVEVDPNDANQGKLVAPDEYHQPVCVDESGKPVQNCVQMQRDESGNFTLGQGHWVNLWSEYIEWDKDNNNVLYVLKGSEVCTAATCPEYESAFEYHLCPAEYSECKYNAKKKGFYCRKYPDVCQDYNDCSLQMGAKIVCDNGECKISECEDGYHFVDDNKDACEVDTTEHCGSSDNRCGTGMICMDGQCSDICESGTHFYLGECEEDSTEHCGSHENDCNKLEGWGRGGCIDKRCRASQCQNTYHLDESFVCRANWVDYCGDNQTICADGQTCLDGHCVDACPSRIWCISSDDQNSNHKKCIDPRTDIEFCGASGDCKGNNRGTKCDIAAGMICVNGHCEPHNCRLLDQSLCETIQPDGSAKYQCVDITSDAQHCGYCNYDCGKYLPKNSSIFQCLNSQCIYHCVDDYTNCGDGELAQSIDCRNTLIDASHCGACDIACSENQFCSSGLCCDNSQMNCHNSCVDLNSNESHCGRCDQKCESDQICSQGLCCGKELNNCNGKCVDLNHNASHCGDCNHICLAGQVCMEGICCNTDQANCDGECVNLKSNNNNCGACGTNCKSDQTCSEGKCLCNNTHLTNCGGSCVNLNENKNYCGACNMICGGSMICSSGKCCISGQTNCNNTCVDLKSNKNNCGTCGHKCGDAQACCSGTCVNVNTTTHCGGCNSCSSGQTCSSGKCCNNGLTNCSGSCVNLKTTNNHCGSCSNKCGNNQHCSSGKCCNTGFTNCSGKCVNLKSDKNNCGTCGKKCGSGKSCNGGTCK